MWCDFAHINAEYDNNNNSISVYKKKLIKMIMLLHIYMYNNKIIIYLLNTLLDGYGTYIQVMIIILGGIIINYYCTTIAETIWTNKMSLLKY